MKEIILGADSDSMIYLVPDEVADNLAEYCLDFCERWLPTSPEAVKYRKIGDEGEFLLCYSDSTFIDYLNEHLFPEYKSIFVRNIGWTNFDENIPGKYKGLPYFFF